MESRRFNLNVNLDISYLSIQSNAESIFCSNNYREYSMNYQCQRLSSREIPKSGNLAQEDYRKLKILESTTDREAITLFCGGSVSSLDWAPSCSKQDKGKKYLAAACNVKDGVSFVQIWCLEDDAR